MTRAKVSDLKAHLSAYLATVRSGKTVIVCDRNTPIARIEPYDTHDDRFVVREPARPDRDLRRLHGVHPRRKVDVVRLLRASRDER